MISANGGLPAHRYTPQVTPRWPQGSEPASVFASIVLCLSVPQPFVPSLQIAWNANSGIGRVLAVKIGPRTTVGNPIPP